MVFIITELYMSIVMLVSLIILSLRKENYKSLMNMMLLFYIITLVIIYDGIINKNISIFIFNYNLKIDYLTIILKSIIVIFMLNYIYTFTLLLKKIKKIKKIKKKFIFKYKNETKLEKNNKRYYRNNLILDSPPKIDLVVLNGSKNKLIEINNTKTTRQCDLLHKYTNALDISILKKNNGFFKNLNIDKKFDYKNFHYYKQCNLIDIKECSANISENIIKDVELNQVLFDLQNNMQDWNSFFFLFKDTQKKIECLQRIHKMEVNEFVFKKSILYQKNIISWDNYVNEFNILKNVLKKNLEHKVFMLENKQKNWQLFINFTNGRKSKNNIFTFENTSNIYKGICDIKNNILDINLNNKAGILFLNSNNNNFYFKNILLNTKYFSKYDTIDLINKDFQIFDHHVIIKKIFFEYNVRNINDFLLVISSLLQNNKNLIYFNNNTLTYSKNLDNNYYYEYSAIDDIEVRSILNVEQNEILNKSLAEIGFDILNN